jgi:hypothetical protein
MKGFLIVHVSLPLWIAMCRPVNASRKYLGYYTDVEFIIRQCIKDKFQYSMNYTLCKIPRVEKKDFESHYTSVTARQLGNCFYFVYF